MTSKSSNNIVQKNILLKKSILTLSPSKRSPSIIRIVPNEIKRTSIPSQKPLKTVTQRRIVVKSNISRPPNKIKKHVFADHDYQHKDEDLGTLPVENLPTTLEQDSGNESNIKIIVPSKILTQKPNISSLKRPLAYSNPTSPEKLMKSHSSNCCSCCRESLDIILRQQAEILLLLRNSHEEKREKINLLPPMPFDDLNDFLDFDESLTNEDVLDQFKGKFKNLLVDSEQKSVSNIMSALLTNNLSKNISWIGVKETIEFGSTHMVGPIVELIQNHHQINIDVVQGRVAEWLRRCTDRINSEMRKNKKKAERRYISI